MIENVKKLADEALESVSGGMTKDLKAAYDCIEGKYGNGADRVAALKAAGFDYEKVQGLVNDILKYEQVAKDTINGKYGNGADRVAALKKAGYDYDRVQNLVNNMLLK